MSNKLRDRLEDRLTRHGFKELGKGLYSVVYGKEGYPWVIKIGSGSEWKYDGWVDYAQLIMRGELPQSSYFPKIKKLFLFKNFYVAIVEHLEYTIYNLKYDIDDVDQKYKNAVQEYRKIEQWVYNRIPINQSGLATIMKNLKKLFGGFDYHEGNVMVRKNGELVLTDPFSTNSIKRQERDWMNTLRGEVFSPVHLKLAA